LKNRFDLNLSKSFKILNASDRKKIYLVVGLNVLLGFLDLIGVAAVGLIGALAVAGFGASVPSSRIGQILEFLSLNNFVFQEQVALLGIGAGFTFIVRTISSIYINRRIMFFFSRKGASISNELFAKVLGQSLNGVRTRTTQEYVYLFGDGVTNLTIGTLATAATITSDIILLVILITGIFVADFTLGLTILMAFGFLALALNKITAKRARNIGSRDAKLSLKTYTTISETIMGFRELYARNMLGNSVKDFQKIRNEHSEILAQRQFLPIFSKYVIECVVIFLALSVAAFQFLTGSAGQAVAALSIFLGAGSRIAPAVLRIQQGLVTLRASAKSTEITLTLITELQDYEPVVGTTYPLELEHAEFFGDINIDRLHFKYKNDSNFALENISIEIPAGIFVAIIGPSGSGKSTLVDAILGLLEINHGSIAISGMRPRDAIMKWPGAIAYVPQAIVLKNQSLLQNVLSGYPDTDSNRQRSTEILTKVHLVELANSLPEGFDSGIGENGDKISGGQAQRLGLARALFPNPKVLFLDEATSALDSETESLISHTLSELHGKTTIVTIAHRLNTIRNADLVIYLNNGKAEAIGTFDYVNSKIPGLASQINTTRPPKN